jgi:hypothetical protein
VADRWHIWHNLCEYAGKAVARHQDCLAGSGCARQGRPDARQQQEQEQQQEEEGGVPAGLEAVIRGRHAAVRELRAAGRTLPEAAAALGLSQQTAGRFWRAASADALLKVRGASALDPWKPYLRRRRDQGITKIAVLHREITALGYAGSEPTTYAWLALLKLAAPPRPAAPPAARQISRWMLTDPARLGEDEQAQLAAALGRFLDEDDVLERARVCVVNRDLYERLFAHDESPDKTIHTLETTFQVVGEFEEPVDTLGRGDVVPGAGGS